MLEKGQRLASGHKGMNMFVLEILALWSFSRLVEYDSFLLSLGHIPCVKPFALRYPTREFRCRQR